MTLDELIDRLTELRVGPLCHDGSLEVQHANNGGGIGTIVIEQDARGRCIVVLYDGEV